MLRSVPLADQRNVDDYREPAGDEAVDRLIKAAEPLKGSRIVHVSSTSYGGGVAELLPTQLALLQDLGIEADWQLIEGSEEFFAITKLVHNGMQGMGVPWNEAMGRIYLEHMLTNAGRFEEGADFVFVHDPQPVALLSFLEEEGRRVGKWIWRCHIDVSFPMEELWSFFAVHAAHYDAAIFTLEEFVRPGVCERVAVIPPSIDPLSPKNASLDDRMAEIVGRVYGIDTARPIVTQVSRFDPWKDPIGVIEAYRAAKREVPDLQLVLVGSMAHDDPEAWHYLGLAEQHKGDDGDLHILTNLQDVGPVAVNAFQRASEVVVQKSLREGFGLTVSEALWKERPVIGGNVGGIRLQVEDGVSGFLVDSPEECAQRMVTLLRDEALRVSMGKAGQARVREHFLSVRELTDYLELLSSLQGARQEGE